MLNVQFINNNKNKTKSLFGLMMKVMKQMKKKLKTKM